MAFLKLLAPTTKQTPAKYLGPYGLGDVQRLVDLYASEGQTSPPRFVWSSKVRLASYFAVSNCLVVNPRFAGEISEPEFRAVLAHEVGHSRRRVLTLLLAVFDMVTTPSALLAGWALSECGIFGLTVPAVLTVMALLRYASSPLVLLEKELDADRFCLRVLADAEPLRTLLVRLAKTPQPVDFVTRNRLQRLQQEALHGTTAH